jgi:hypothetical protein
MAKSRRKLPTKPQRSTLKKRSDKTAAKKSSPVVTKRRDTPRASTQELFCVVSAVTSMRGDSWILSKPRQDGSEKR